jgi:hypothetical protein
MRIVEPPSLDSPGRGRHGDDLDRLLSDFYRSELPNPWPVPPVAGVRTEFLPLTAPPLIRRWSAVRSRFALAASVALLLAGSWFLSGKFEDVPASGAFNSTGESADKNFDQPDFQRPGKRLKEDGIRTRERIILDKNGQTGFRVDLDLP